jgi:hypothetical protein
MADRKIVQVRRHRAMPCAVSDVIFWPFPYCIAKHQSVAGHRVGAVRQGRGVAILSIDSTNVVCDFGEGARMK